MAEGTEVEWEDPRKRKLELLARSAALRDELSAYGDAFEKAGHVVDSALETVLNAKTFVERNRVPFAVGAFVLALGLGKLFMGGGGSAKEESIVRVPSSPGMFGNLANLGKYAVLGWQLFQRARPWLEKGWEVYRNRKSGSA